MLQFVSLPIACPSTEQARHCDVLDSPWYIQNDLGKSMIWSMHVLSCSCFLYCCCLWQQLIFLFFILFFFWPYNNGQNSLLLNGCWPNNNPRKLYYKLGKDLHTLPASTLGVGPGNRLGKSLGLIPGVSLPSKLSLSSSRAL